MADRDQQSTGTEGGSPSPASLVGWTVAGAAAGLVVYRAANDLVMGRVSLGEIVVGVIALAVGLLAVQRLARLLA